MIKQIILIFVQVWSWNPDFQNGVGHELKRKTATKIIIFLMECEDDIKYFEKHNQYEHLWKEIEKNGIYGLDTFFTK